MADSAVDTELREFLLPLKDAPVPVVAQMLLRYSIPRHDAYRLVVEEALPRRPTAELQLHRPLNFEALHTQPTVAPGTLMLARCASS